MKLALQKEVHNENRRRCYRGRNDYLPAATSIEKPAEKLRKLFLSRRAFWQFRESCRAYLFVIEQWINKLEENGFTIRHTPTWSISLITSRILMAFSICEWIKMFSSWKDSSSFPYRENQSTVSNSRWI